jgi:hypothetical protein
MNELVLIATRTTLPTTAIIAAAGERGSCLTIVPDYPLANNSNRSDSR